MTGLVQLEDESRVDDDEPRGRYEGVKDGQQPWPYAIHEVTHVRGESDVASVTGVKFSAPKTVHVDGNDRYHRCNDGDDGIATRADDLRLQWRGDDYEPLTGHKHLEPGRESEGRMKEQIGQLARRVGDTLELDAGDSEEPSVQEHLDENERIEDGQSRKEHSHRRSAHRLLTHDYQRQQVA